VRNTATVVLLPCLLLAGCDRFSGQRGETIALQGSCQTTFDPPPTPTPVVFRQIDEGRCDLQGLGEVAFRSSKEIDTQTGTQATSELVLTFPNGDVLRGTGGGQNVPGDPGTISFTAALQLSGGTGRYANATGEAEASGTANMVQRNASFTLTGEVHTTR
jgi:hypothetical protein